MEEEESSAQVFFAQFLFNSTKVDQKAFKTFLEQFPLTLSPFLSILVATYPSPSQLWYYPQKTEVVSLYHAKHFFVSGFALSFFVCIPRTEENLRLLAVYSAPPHLPFTWRPGRGIVFQPDLLFMKRQKSPRSQTPSLTHVFHLSLPSAQKSG